MPQGELADLARRIGALNRRPVAEAGAEPVRQRRRSPVPALLTVWWRYAGCTGPLATSTTHFHQRAAEEIGRGAVVDPVCLGEDADVCGRDPEARRAERLARPRAGSFDAWGAFFGNQGTVRLRFECGSCEILWTSGRFVQRAEWLRRRPYRAWSEGCAGSGTARRRAGGDKRRRCV